MNMDRTCLIGRTTTRWIPAKDSMLSGNLPLIAVSEERSLVSDGKLFSTTRTENNEALHRTCTKSRQQSSTIKGNAINSNNNNINSNHLDYCCPTRRSTVLPKLRWPPQLKRQTRAQWPFSSATVDVDLSLNRNEPQTIMRRKRMKTPFNRLGKPPYHSGNILATTILIIIAYELFIRLVIDYHHTSTASTTCQRCPPLLGFIKPCSAEVASMSTAPAPVTTTTITTTMATTTTTTTTMTTTTKTFNATIMSPNEHVAGLLSNNATLSTITQLEQNKKNHTKSSLPSNQTEAANLTTQTYNANTNTNVNNNNNNNNNVSQTATTTKVVTQHVVGGSGGDFIKRVANKQHNYYKQHYQTSAMPTVLCNSRCNCVILESMISGQASINQLPLVQQVTSPPTSAAAANRSSLATVMWRDGAPNQENQSASISRQPDDPPAATSNGYLAANNGSAPGNQQQPQLQLQLQQQLRTEQALIAFNEDYSLDYEHSSVGNAVVDDTGAPDIVEQTAASGTSLSPAASSGNSNHRTTTAAAAAAATTTTTTATTTPPTSIITNSMPPDNAQGGANIPMMVAQQSSRLANQSHSAATQLDASQTGSARNHSKLLDGANGNNGAGENQVGLSAFTATDPSDAFVVSGGGGGGGFRQQQLENSRSSTLPSTTTTTTTTARTNGSQISGESGRANVAFVAVREDRKSGLLAGKAAQQANGMTLFPLPTHLHNHLRAHHHPHQHQPLGAGSGRDANGPQLYAQSLYSSQAPKLSYHAHTPYLMAQVQPAANNLGLPVLVTGQQQQQQQQTMMAADSQQVQPSTAAAQANHPYQGGYSPHMRSTYSGHHLRQLNPIRTSNSLLSSQTNDHIPNNNNHVPQQRVLLALRTLDLSTKLKWTNPQPTKDSSADTNWHESPELISNIEAMLLAIERDNIQSLILRDNELQFELWSELYALLAVQMRQHLFHIDLSHNALPKLGITFTGYIEHHLAAHGSWPFNSNSNNNNNNNGNQTFSISANQSGAMFGPNEVGNQPNGAKQIKSPASASASASASAAATLNRANPTRPRHSLLSGGKLYTLVQQRLVAGRPSFSINQTIGGHWRRQQIAPQTSANLTHVTLLQQPLLVRALDLSHNRLKWLINDQFRALKYVQTIRLDHNRIRYIHQHAFSGLESLRFLNLNFNRLQVIYIEQFQTNYNLLVSVAHTINLKETENFQFFLFFRISKLIN